MEMKNSGKKKRKEKERDGGGEEDIGKERRRSYDTAFEKLRLVLI